MSKGKGWRQQGINAQILMTCTNQLYDTVKRHAVFLREGTGDRGRGEGGSITAF